MIVLVTSFCSICVSFKNSYFKGVEYYINVKTGSNDGAGTDGNVFINVYGPNTNTGRIQLDNSLSWNKHDELFKVGGENDFKFMAPKLN